MTMIAQVPTHCLGAVSTAGLKSCCGSLFRRTVCTSAKMTSISRLLNTRKCLLFSTPAYITPSCILLLPFSTLNRSHTLASQRLCKGKECSSNDASIGLLKILRRWSSQTNDSPEAQYRYRKQQQMKQKSMMMYITGILILALGFGYAAVPLYRIFCQTTSYGGTTQRGHDASKVATMKKVKDRPIQITFTADTYLNVPWKFKPQQDKITVVPGETVLAFYTAKNLADRPITGIATYNVIPYDAGLYFNKVQCFCFEEQRLNPHEEVDMPVFFYIDPDFDEDPKMATVDEILLSYTFFEAKPGFEIPLPGFLKPSTPSSGSATAVQ